MCALKLDVLFHPILKGLETVLVSGHRVFVSREQFMGAAGRDTLQEVGDVGKVRVALPLVVELSGTEKVELWAVISEAVDLTVIQLDRANGLAGREPRPAFRAQT